jgi:hypothetical protein
VTIATNFGIDILLGFSDGNPIYLFSGVGGPTDMIGGSDQYGDRYFDTLGKENITINNSAASGVTDDIFYGAFNVDEGPADPRYFADGHFFTGVLPVINTDYESDHFGDFLTGTVYNSHGATGLNKVTTINNFVAGSKGDVIHFQDGSWADTYYSTAPGQAGDGVGLEQLVSGDLNTFPDHSAIIFDTGTGTPTAPMPGNADLIVDQFQAYANAGVLLKDLESSTNGHYLQFDNNFTISRPNSSFNVLVAYQNTAGGVNIADVELITNSHTGSVGPFAFSYDFKIVASDLITLTGVSLSSLASHNVHFDMI